MTNPIRRLRAAAGRLIAFLRAAHEPAYLHIKAHEFQRVGVWATLFTASFVAMTWSWDYAVDPAHFTQAVRIRLLEALSLAALSWLMRFGARRWFVQVALVAAVLWVEVSFIHILTLLDRGPSAGAGGFLFFLVFVPFICWAQSLRFTVAVLGLVAALPYALLLIGRASHVELALFNAYVWLPLPAVVLILTLLEALCLRVFHSGRELQERAGTDPLTGLPNRRNFEMQAAPVLHAAAREQRPVALLFVDVDHFKSINDRFGHSTGDDVLRGLSGVFMSLLRESDLIGRYGGEEFVILLHDAGMKRAEGIAERLREAVEQRALSPGRDGVRPIHLTVSVGLAGLRPDGRHADLAALVERADDALYEAKRRGRNRVVVDRGPSAGALSGGGAAG